MSDITHRNDVMNEVEARDAARLSKSVEDTSSQEQTSAITRDTKVGEYGWAIVSDNTRLGTLK